MVFSPANPNPWSDDTSRKEHCLLLSRLSKVHTAPNTKILQDARRRVRRAQTVAYFGAPTKWAAPPHSRAKYTTQSRVGVWASRFMIGPRFGRIGDSPVYYHVESDCDDSSPLKLWQATQEREVSRSSISINNKFHRCWQREV